MVILLVNALDAFIFVESEEGKGSTFTVLIPATKRIPLENICPSNNINDKLVDRENRIVKEIAIEFSDIYF